MRPNKRDHRGLSYRFNNRKSLQGQRNLNAQDAEAIQAKDFNHMTRDLIDAIAKGHFPKWDLYVQVLQPSQLAALDYDALDATKVWTNVPETKIGTMTLNRNPDNVFLETEQSALAPSNLVPGIEPSEDRLLQGRLFSYADTQLHRVGTNGLQLPVNRPRSAVLNYNQNGAQNPAARKGEVNYEPSKRIAVADNAQHKYSQLPLTGTTQQERIAKTRNFQQAGEFYRSLNKQQQANLVSNLAGDLGQVKDDNIKYTMLFYFQRADAAYGKALGAALKADAGRIDNLAAALRD